MSIAERIAAEIVSLMEAVKRNDLGVALLHQGRAFKLTQIAIKAIELEIGSRELDKKPIGPLHSMKLMYVDVAQCLSVQRDGIERLAIVFAKIQAKHSGVVGKA